MYDYLHRQVQVCYANANLNEPITGGTRVSLRKDSYQIETRLAGSSHIASFSVTSNAS
jgi:hypothetical protein